MEEEQKSASTKRVKKVGKGGKSSSRPSLGSPGKGKMAVGIRTRRQAQLEEEGDVVKREPGEDDEALVKEEKDINDDLESNLPDINHIINDRS
jgi:hypothetical protein